MMNRRKVIIYAVLLFGAILLLFSVQYVLSLRSLTINYTNIQTVQLYKTERLDSGKATKAYKTIKHSGDTVKIPKGEYTIHYTGKTGYQSRFTTFTLNNKKSIALSPLFSDQKLAELLQQEQPDIISVLTNTFDLQNYTIGTGALYDNGAWYGTQLKYVGNDIYNADTLRVILHKEQGLWVIKTNPPDITFNKFVYPSIPEAILRAVNSQ